GTTRTTSTATGATAKERSRPARRSTGSSCSGGSRRARPRAAKEPARPARGASARAPRAHVVRPAPARRAAHPPWAAVPWRERLAIVRRAAEHISDHLMPYSAALAVEVGKNRSDALGTGE